MKVNSRKILLLLSGTPDYKGRIIPTSTLTELLPELSSAGVRSLLYWWQKKDLVERYKTALPPTWLSPGSSLRPEFVIKLSPLGRRVVETIFPLLSGSRSGHERSSPRWQVLICGASPPFDRQFRSLRQQLLKYRVIPLNRGVYIQPGTWHPTLWDEIVGRYRQFVTVLSINEWVVGNPGRFIREYYEPDAQLQTYSGISDEMDRLLSAGESWSGMTHQQKQLFLSLYTRFIDAFGQDTGVMKDQKIGLELLQRFQQIVTIEDLELSVAS